MTMAFMEGDGFRLYYEDTGGDAPAVLFLHGAGGNHLSWWQQVPVFAEEYRCITGVFLCAREAGRHMIAGRRGGRIVNTASIMGFSGGGLYPNLSYQATKGAVVNMTRALAVEWAREGIRVNGIAPTWVRTPLTRGITENPELVRRIEQITPMGRLAEPQEIVGAVLFLASRASAMVTGHVLAIDGGFLAQ